MIPKLLRARDVAAILGVSVKTVHNGGAGTCRLTRRRLGRAIRYLLPEVENLRDRGYVHSPAERGTTPFRAKGYIYAVRMTLNDQTVAIKIGHSLHPQRRVKDMASANPFPLTIITYWPVKHYTDEALLHDQFAQHKISGEWFKPHPEILAFLADQHAFSA
jgi:hypothetical protein